MKELIEIFLDNEHEKYSLPYKHNGKLIAFDRNMLSALRFNVSDCDYYATRHYTSAKLYFKNLDASTNSAFNISLKKLSEGIKTAELMPKKDREKVLFSFENKYPANYFTLRQLKRLQKATEILAEPQIKILSIGYNRPCLFEVANAEIFLLSLPIDNTENYIIISI